MIYILVEGHGDTGAVSNLVNRLWNDLQLPYIPIHTPGIRWKNLHQRKGLERGVEYIRTKHDASGLLIVRDDEDNCPVDVVPTVTGILREFNAPFPIAYHIMYREFETLFLPCLRIFAGREIKYDFGEGKIRIHPKANFEGDFERNRDAKGIMSQFFPPGKSYKPSLDQLPLTRLINFEILRQSELACFGTLERCLNHLANNQENPTVYP